MTTIWIVAADSSRARVLQVMDREQRLQEIEELLNPGGRLNDRGLTTDANPRLHGPGGLSAREEPSAVEVAPPRFLGLLRRELGKEVQKLVSEELPKDLSWLSAREIEERFAKGNGRGR